MKRLLLGLTCFAVLAGCDTVRRATPFAVAYPEAPLPFRASLSATRRSPDFSVSVDASGAPLAQWRESARYQGTRFCLRRFGGSEIAWQNRGTADDWVVARAENGRAVVRGRCVSR